MAIDVKCPNPNCTNTQTVIEDGNGRLKRKKCRKCGTPMTLPQPKPPEPQKKITVEELAEKYPDQVTEIVKTAQDEVVREQIGELNTGILLAQYPDLVEMLTSAAKETTAKETAEAIAKEISEKVRAKIAKMSANKFAGQFPELAAKIVKAGDKAKMGK